MRLGKLGETMQGLRDTGMLSIVDIVLNHTANDSKWIVDHPEATYNTDDCPHLYCAWLFDKMI
jgi:glycogen debranching enzyme